MAMPLHANDSPFPGADAADRKWKAVFTIIEPKNGSNERKPVWLRIGIAFVNRDGSLNVRLDAIPTNATLHIRDSLPPDEGRPRRDREDMGVFAPKGMV